MSSASSVVMFEARDSTETIGPLGMNFELTATAAFEIAAAVVAQVEHERARPLLLQTVERGVELVAGVAAEDGERDVADLAGKHLLVDAELMDLRARDRDAARSAAPSRADRQRNVRAFLAA